MEIGFFYQIWYSNKTAIFEALKQLRKVYPNNKLYFLPSGLSKSEVEEYHKNFTTIIEKEFNITKTEYLFKENHKWLFDTETKRNDFIEYGHVVLDKTIFMPDNDIDIIINGSEDWYVFKPLPITGEFEVSGRITGWDPWMNQKLMREKFNYNINPNPLWFQHGHYINIKLFKEKYTEENKNYVINALKEAYPVDFKLFPDYIFSVWNVFAFTKFQQGSDYIYELSSELSNETPLETFQKTNCYSRHGYKALYGAPLTEEMIQLGIK